MLKDWEKNRKIEETIESRLGLRKFGMQTFQLHLESSMFRVSAFGSSKVYEKRNNSEA